MANIPISGLPAGTTKGTDIYPAVDQTDHSEAPTGTTKKYTISGLITYIDANLGTVTSGVWNATPIATLYGGTGQTTYTDGQLLIGNTTSGSLSLNTLTAGTGISITNGHGTITIANTISAGVTSITGTAGQILANGSSSPQTGAVTLTIDPTYLGQTSITTLGTIITGSWDATVIGLAYGGTNANLTASNGGIFYSTATTGAILAGTPTADQILLSGASAAPSWSTATYPATTIVNQLLYSSAANTITGLTTANQGVLVTNGSGVPAWTASMTNGQLIIGSTSGVPIPATLTAGANVTITNGPGTITIASTGGAAGVSSITGTVHQVLANGTSGSPQTGAVTLTTPQDIDIASSPTFAQVRTLPSGDPTQNAGFSSTGVIGTIGDTVPLYSLNLRNEMSTSTALNMYGISVVNDYFATVLSTGAKFYDLYIASTIDPANRGAVSTAIAASITGISDGVGALGSVTSNIALLVVSATTSITTNVVTAAFLGAGSVSSGTHVGFGTLTPNTSAIIDVISTTAGIGLPAMTTVQKTAIASPRDGLLVYDDTLELLSYYNATASAWYGIPNNSGTDGQLLIGNSTTGMLQLNTLTAGANVTITNGHGTITIASTGGGAGVSSITGTANEVLANGTSGTPQTGAVTLTIAPTFLPSFPYIVGPNGPYTTIQSAINAANATTPTGSAPAMVLINAGTYTEDLTLYSFVYLSSFGMSDGDVTVVGNATYNAAASSGEFSSSGITYQTTTSSPSFYVTGTNSCTVSLNNCTFIGSSGPCFQLDNAIATCYMSYPTMFASAGQTVLNINTGNLTISSANMHSTDTSSVVSGGALLVIVGGYIVDTYILSGATVLSIVNANFGVVSALSTLTIGAGCLAFIINALVECVASSGFWATGSAGGELAYNGITNLGSANQIDPTLSIGQLSTSSAQGSYGTTNPDPSAILDLVSTTQGLGWPSMTTTQVNAISSPREGLTVYDNVLHLPYYYNGTAWTPFGSGSGAVSSVTGTQYQVLVNGTYGSPQTGALTLTTPQNIDTTSSPTFAALTLNASNDPSNLSILNLTNAIGTTSPGNNADVYSIKMQNNMVLTGLSLSAYGLYINNTYTYGLTGTLLDYYDIYTASTLNNAGPVSIHDLVSVYINGINETTPGHGGTVTRNTALIVQNTPSSSATNIYTALFSAPGGASAGTKVGIGTTTPDVSTVLDIVSITAGLGLPQMTTTQKNAISTPRVGLFVYDNTVNNPYYYNGSAWVSVSGGGSGWSLTGNSGTTAGTDFVGTTDAQDLVFKANSVEIMRTVESTANLQISNAGLIVGFPNAAISTDDDSGSLAIYGGTYGDGAYLILTGSTSSLQPSIIAAITNQLVFSTTLGSSPYVTIQPQGVGSGPTVDFGNSTDSVVAMGQTSADPTTIGAAGGILYVSSTDNNLYFLNATANYKLTPTLAAQTAATAAVTNTQPSGYGTVIVNISTGELAYYVQS